VKLEPAAAAIDETMAGTCEAGTGEPTAVPPAIIWISVVVTCVVTVCALAVTVTGGAADAARVMVTGAAEAACAVTVMILVWVAFNPPAAWAPTVMVWRTVCLSVLTIMTVSVIVFCLLSLPRISPNKSRLSGSW
jgi:hypothetical protein